MSDLIFDPSLCELGEGALWHPLRQELFWFDILGRKLHARRPATGDHRSYELPRLCSAAAWIDENRLLIASENGLDLFDLQEGQFTEHLCDLEADNRQTRSNDGRADPKGGFWIGTMGKAGESGAGAIYRFYRGELQMLFSEITISNAICFAPSGLYAYFADTAKRQIYRCALDVEGWPMGAAEVFADLNALGYNPDGAICLSDGSLRVALWGKGAILAISSKGVIGDLQILPAPHVTCPAAGGPAFNRLYCTSAQEHMSAAQLREAPLSGATFELSIAVPGLAEPRFYADY